MKNTILIALCIFGLSATSRVQARPRNAIIGGGTALVASAIREYVPPFIEKVTGRKFRLTKKQQRILNFTLGFGAIAVLDLCNPSNAISMNEQNITEKVAYALTYLYLDAE